jgi:hypothetical protein
MDVLRSHSPTWLRLRSPEETIVQDARPRGQAPVTRPAETPNVWAFPGRPTTKNPAGDTVAVMAYRDAQKVVATK